MEGEVSLRKVNSAFRHLGLAETLNRSSSQSSFNYRGASSSPSSTDSNSNKDSNGFLEADMSDSVFDYPLRKQCSTSILTSPNPQRLGVSASHPNLIAKDDLQLLRSSKRTPTPPPLPLSTPPTTTLGLDITENGDQDKYLTLEPIDLSNFRKWIVGFCIVNFDLEIGQGKVLFFHSFFSRAFFLLLLLLTHNPFFYYCLALDYAYPPMDLTLIEQKNM